MYFPSSLRWPASDLCAIPVPSQVPDFFFPTSALLDTIHKIVFSRCLKRLIAMLFMLISLSSAAEKPKLVPQGRGEGYDRDVTQLSLFFCCFISFSFLWASRGSFCISPLVEFKF